MNPLAFIPKELLLPLVIALVAGGVGFGLGGKYVYGKWLDEKAAMATKAVQVVTRQGQVTERVVVRWKDREAATKTVTETIEKEVIRYVPLSADLVLPLGWRLLHDAAAAGAVPQAPAGADVAAPSVTASAAAKTVIGNYGAARICQAQLEALQDWVRGEYEISNGQPLRWPP